MDYSTQEKVYSSPIQSTPANHCLLQPLTGTVYPATVYATPLQSTPPHYGLLYPLRSVPPYHDLCPTRVYSTPLWSTHPTTAVRVTQEASSMPKNCDEFRPRGLLVWREPLSPSSLCVVSSFQPSSCATLVWHPQPFMRF